MRNFARGIVAGAALCAPLGAQTLYMMDSISGVVVHQSSRPGTGVCAQPDPLGLTPWSYSVPPPCGGTPPVLVAGGVSDGDVAVDRLTDLVYVTDGLAIGEFHGDPACDSGIPPGTILNTYTIPPIPSAPSPGGALGLLRGMGIDPVAGILWISDGYAIAGLSGFGAPAGSCPTLVLAVAAFAPQPLLPGFNSISDLTWDPVSGSLWITDIGTDSVDVGYVHNITVTGASITTHLIVGFLTSAGTCSTHHLVLGIAFDLATPNGTSPPAFYVADAFGRIAYVDATSAPLVIADTAPSTFYTPEPCGFSETLFVTGLAYSSGGITYGTPEDVMQISSFGQSTSPSTTFGIEVSNSPPNSQQILVAGFDYACPGPVVKGTSLWVGLGPPPAIILPLPSLPPDCTSILTPLPANIPAGVSIFVQVVAMSGGTAVDSTQGLEFTITAP